VFNPSPQEPAAGTVLPVLRQRDWALGTLALSADAVPRRLLTRPV